jgi:hypothetical protein
MQTKYRAKYRKMVQLILLGLAFTAIILGACYKVDAESTYYFIIEKKENPAGGAVSFPYHWMWYEKDREPSTNTLGIPIQLTEVSIEGFKKALAPYLSMNNIQSLQIYYEDSYCWKLKGTSVQTTTSYVAPPPSPTSTSTTSTTISTEEPQGIGGLSLELFIIIVAIVIVLVLLL